MKKKWLFAICFIFIGFLTGCGANKEKKEAPKSETKQAETKKEDARVTASGSSALLPLAKDAAEEFKKKNPNVSVILNGGGSGTGLKQVSDGSVDIGNSDVPAEDKLDPAKAKELVDHKACTVTMAAIVNKDVGEKVKSLTKDQLIKIFTGKSKNWKEFGGPNEEIIVISRPSTSGTRALFKKFALNGKDEISGGSLETDDSGTLLQNIKENKGSIGYIAIPYLLKNKDVTAIAINGVKPTLENTYEGKYPVWGYEHMYTKGEAKGEVKAFIDFVLSSEYGKKIEAQGYGVASKMKVSK